MTGYVVPSILRAWRPLCPITTTNKTAIPRIIHDPETGERRLVLPTRYKTFEVLSLPDGFANPFSAFTDWLNCTFVFVEAERDLGSLFRLVFSLFGDKFAPAIDLKRGFHGWTRSFSLGETGAKFAYGGQNSRAILSLSGEACSLVNDWPRVVECLRSEFDARITRWDGAVDDYIGEHSVDMALELYQCNQFGLRGRRPLLNQHGNWVEPDGRGRTLEIGTRASGKMLRVYEKGAQLGANGHPWVRWELELHGKGRNIPLEVLTQPGNYLVGAYPIALQWIKADASRFESIRRAAQVSYGHLTSCASAQYGKLIDLMVKNEGSAERVVEMLRKPGIPKRLQHPLMDKPSEWLE